MSIKVGSSIVSNYSKKLVNPVVFDTLINLAILDNTPKVVATGVYVTDCGHKTCDPNNVV